MKPKRPTKPKAIHPAKPGFDGLVRELREFITESRRQVMRAVDVVQVRTCWDVGRHIVEFMGIWESVHPLRFNSGEFASIESQAGLNSYKLSVRTRAFPA